MIYIDKTGHLASDTDLNELHRFAQCVLGFKHWWFQNTPGHPHYDVTTKTKRALAIKKGAREVSDRELIYRCCLGGTFNRDHFPGVMAWGEKQFAEDKSDE